MVSPVTGLRKTVGEGPSYAPAYDLAYSTGPTMTTHPALTSVSALVPWGSALVLPGNGRKTAVPIGDIQLVNKCAPPRSWPRRSAAQVFGLGLWQGRSYGGAARKGDVWNIRPLCAFAHRCGDLGWSLEQRTWSRTRCPRTAQTSSA